MSNERPKEPGDAGTSSTTDTQGQGLNPPDTKEPGDVGSTTPVTEPAKGPGKETGAERAVTADAKKSTAPTKSRDDISKRLAGAHARSVDPRRAHSRT